MFWKAVQSVLSVLAVLAGLAQAQDASPANCAVYESLTDAWWTGPMLAPSAATLPRGHFLIEPYVYDVVTQGRYDRNGVKRSALHSNDVGSLTYMLYGVTNKLTLGLIPTAGVNTASAGPNAAIGMGDLTLQAQYRLRQFHEGSWMPTISFAVQESLPTGKYDRLSQQATGGFGTGTHTTTLALYSQTYFWLPNGRILRARLNVLQAFSSTVNVQDASVYGTGTGFRGQASPGPSSFVDGATEYSLTQRWVLALDLTYSYSGNTRVAGYNTHDGIPSSFDSDSSDALGLAPAIEYNLSSKLGVLVGVRIIPAGRNTSATITPAVAINFVH